jgi:hypothetical protein
MSWMLAGRLLYVPASAKIKRYLSMSRIGW